jgi:PTH1 family peptidyl-tRNA hydrolase
MYIVVGLGNPGDQYVNTRHNTGRLAEEYLTKNAKLDAQFLFLGTFMNKSGGAVAKAVKSKVKAKSLIVIYDDLDLPLGAFRISYNRSSGGHKGVESIIKALGTQEFIRIRIGISPTTPSGKLKKPRGEKDVEKHILGEFKKSEVETLTKVFKKVAAAVETVTVHGYQAAMTEFNK